MDKELFLIKVKVSRKAFLPLYFLILVVIGTLGFLYFKGYAVNRVSLIASFVFSVFAIKLIEIERQRDWWAVTNTSLVQSTGILNKNVKEIDFSSISDLDLDKPLFKRFLNYGNVNVRVFFNENSICIRDINQPERFIEFLQGVMNTHKKREKEEHGIR